MPNTKAGTTKETAVKVMVASTLCIHSLAAPVEVVGSVGVTGAGFVPPVPSSGVPPVLLPVSVPPVLLPVSVLVLVPPASPPVPESASPPVPVPLSPVPLSPPAAGVTDAI